MLFDIIITTRLIISLAILACFFFIFPFGLFVDDHSFALLALPLYFVF